MCPQRYKILCVEADDDLRDLFSLFLDQESSDLQWADSLASARRIARSEDFSLYIVDEEYPDGIGLDFIREVRAIGSRIPIVYQSAYGYPENIRQGLDAGANFYLVKPFDMDELVEIVKLVSN